MLSSAILAAEKDYLEYVQIVSFGCGHDAYLSDEIIRLMKDISGKTPLILKLDESDIQGPLRIRIRSFTETVAMQRSSGKKLTVHELPDPYPVKYTKASRKEKVALIPNTSHAFSRVMAAAFAGQGIRTEPLELGREEAIRLGKQYVHNDICFPAQIVIGEALAALKSGKYDDKEVAIGMGKYVGDCRLTHYSALLRKALDDAGYSYVPILTNDDKDSHDLHPGFKMNLLTAVRIAFAMPMIDVLEELLRKTRSYEKVPGSADTAFEKALDQLCSLPDEKMVSLLASLALQAAPGGRGRLIFSPQGRAQIGAAVVAKANEALAARGAGALALAQETRPLRGGFILADGPVEVNCSFEAMLRLRREALEKPVAEILFGQGKA